MGVEPINDSRGKIYQKPQLPHLVTAYPTLPTKPNKLAKKVIQTFVDPRGFEPRLVEPKSIVLPLHHGPVNQTPCRMPRPPSRVRGSLMVSIASREKEDLQQQSKELNQIARYVHSLGAIGIHNTYIEPFVLAMPARRRVVITFITHNIASPRHLCCIFVKATLELIVRFVLVWCKLRLYLLCPSSNVRLCHRSKV